MMTVTPDMLSLFLGETVDDDRATLLIAQASALCATIVVDPDLPDGMLPAPPPAADPIVLTVAANAYVNPSNRSSQLAGPFQMTGSIGGLTLTRSQRSDLRRLAGRSGAFSVNLLPACYDSSSSS